MVWALKNLPGTDELMEYEAKLNLLTPQHSCSLVCMYDINKFSGRAIADVLATHSHVIMNGKIHENPHYIEPIEFYRPYCVVENARWKRKKYSLCYGKFRCY